MKTMYSGTMLHCENVDAIFVLLCPLCVSCVIVLGGEDNDVCVPVSSLHYLVFCVQDLFVFVGCWCVACPRPNLWKG